MAYSDFSLEIACSSFLLDLNQEVDLFTAVPAARITDLLRESLAEYLPLATSIHTEKARSEFIVAPILGEVRRLMKHKVSLFSGIDFHVDPEKGLNGTCDFIVAASHIQLFLRSPVLMVVEAKNDNIKSGLGQCVAEMVAARLFNERTHEGPSTIHGAVTTGNLWQFLKLEGGVVYVDKAEYHVDQIEKVVGILLHCVGGDPAKVGAAA
jgi:hypothetical protein